MTAEFRAVFTNKTIVTPYRGAGRQHGVFVIERLLDLAARELGHRPRARSAGATSSRPTRFPLQQRDHLPGLRAARLRQRQLRAGARQGAGDDRLRAFLARGAAAAARRGAATSASASSATSRAPASDPIEGARVQVQPSGKVTRRHRHRHAGAGALHRASPRSPPSSSASTCATSTWSPATPTSSTGAPAPSPAAAPWSPATPAHEAATSVREKVLQAAGAFRVRQEDLVAGGRQGVQVAGVPERSIALGELAAARQPDARRGQAGHRAGAGGHPLLRPGRWAPPPAACTP